MFRKVTYLLAACSALFTLAACMPAVGAEQAVSEATMAPLGTSHVPLEEIISTPILEPSGQAPASILSEELVMATEPTDTQIDKPEADAEPPADQPSPEPALQPAIQSWVDQAKADLALRQEIATDQIELLSYEDKVWSDAGRGCPQPGMRYKQVMVEGFLIRLQIGDQIYNYHGGGSQPPALCEEPGPKITITKQAPFNIKETPTKSVPPPRK